MKRFNNKCARFCLVLEAATKLTNFLHRQCMNFDPVVPEEQEEKKDEFGWGGDL